MHRIPHAAEWKEYTYVMYAGVCAPPTGLLQGQDLVGPHEQLVIGASVQRGMPTDAKRTPTDKMAGAILFWDELP